MQHFGNPKKVIKQIQQEIYRGNRHTDNINMLFYEICDMRLT